MAAKVARVDKRLYFGCTPAERERVSRRLGQIQATLAQFEEALPRIQPEERERFFDVERVVESGMAMHMACAGCGRPPALGCKCKGPDGQPLDWN